MGVGGATARCQASGGCTVRNCVRHMPQMDDPKTLRQYARCYILLLIGGCLMTVKSNNLVHLLWLPLLQDFEKWHGLSWGSAVLAWTYHSLYFAAHRGMTNIVGYKPLFMSWWYPSEQQVFLYPMAARLIRLMQQSRDQHETRVLQWRLSLNQLWMDEVRTKILLPNVTLPCRLCAHPGLSMRQSGAQMSVVSLVYFNIVKFHQVNRVKR
ncbi:hypothetical protein Ahy_B07g086900 [Arachis hypogaea]|uniref:Aminotransferase-like plant mobile domain-containing protein n=1 Tax=Arachis hypogaea TaxID=3818 RepID=A0A444YAT5_ARAHY|nr:hypothetical protein Ahy_B07g086900 [Arachis hypogaea]